MALDGCEITNASVDDRSLEVVVGSDSRFFDGHFPERPILPAVAQLTLVEVLLRRCCGDAARIAALERLRLLAVVQPGDRLLVRLAPAPAGDRSARFEITCGTTRVSDGTLRWSAVEE